MKPPASKGWISTPPTATADGTLTVDEYEIAVEACQPSPDPNPAGESETAPAAPPPKSDTPPAPAQPPTGGNATTPATVPPPNPAKPSTAAARRRRPLPDNGEAAKRPPTPRPPTGGPHRAGGGPRSVHSGQAVTRLRLGAEQIAAGRRVVGRPIRNGDRRAPSPPGRAACASKNPAESERLQHVFDGAALLAQAADSVSSPTGPPPNLSIISHSKRRSCSSKPRSSTFSRSSPAEPPRR
jgi:hypothetical protein